MCGIAGFLSNEAWKRNSDLSWIEQTIGPLSGISAGSIEISTLRKSVDHMIRHFDQLMEFSFHFSLVSDPEFFSKVEYLAELLEKALERLSKEPLTEEIESLSQDIGDFIWQIRAEVIKNVARTNELINPDLLSKGPSRPQRFVAWAIERVLENIDRLEVRGRDSAGISIQIMTAGDSLRPMIEELTIDRGLKKSSRIQNGVSIGFQEVTLPSGGLCLTFSYKVANLVGHLGDNTKHIRNAVRNDEELWNIAALTHKINIIAHTRWASNGIISLSNCHPVDGELYEKEDAQSIDDRNTQFVLNGDVDNYHYLVENFVHSRGYQIEPSVTTDAKILPVFYRLGTSLSQPHFKRFAELMNSCEGSLAVVMQHPLFPDQLVMGQKGSGQSLFIGEPIDGFILASEVYGLAAWTRQSMALSGLEKGGSGVVISTESGLDLKSYFLEDGSPSTIKKEPIYIHSRDIYRGDFAYYFEKEIHEAPSSIRKTIKGKYKKKGREIEFVDGGHSAFESLVSRLRDTTKPRIKRIMVIGQGTASIAAKGVAYLIEKAIEGLGIVVTSCKASELSGFFPAQSLDDMLLIAISQSGTTTDTNENG